MSLLTSNQKSGLSRLFLDERMQRVWTMLDRDSGSFRSEQPNGFFASPTASVYHTCLSALKDYASIPAWSAARLKREYNQLAMDARKVADRLVLLNDPELRAVTDFSDTESLRWLARALYFSTMTDFPPDKGDPDYYFRATLNLGLPDIPQLFLLISERAKQKATARRRNVRPAIRGRELRFFIHRLAEHFSSNYEKPIHDLNVVIAEIASVVFNDTVTEKRVSKQLTRANISRPKLPPHNE
jgi:hypothetical protein